MLFSTKCVQVTPSSEKVLKHSVQLFPTWLALLIAFAVHSLLFWFSSSCLTLLLSTF